MYCVEEKRGHQLLSFQSLIFNVYNPAYNMTKLMCMYIPTSVKY